jgi:hypothetical protein
MMTRPRFCRRWNIQLLICWDITKCRLDECSGSAEHNETRVYTPATLFERWLRGKYWRHLVTLRHSPSAAPEGNVLACSYRNWHSSTRRALVQPMWGATPADVLPLHRTARTVCLPSGLHICGSLRKNFDGDRFSWWTESRGAGTEPRFLRESRTSQEQMAPPFLLLRGEQGGCLILVIFLGSFTMFSVARWHSVGLYDEFWTLKWKWFGRKQSWTNMDTIPVFSWRNRKIANTSVRVDGVAVEIWAPPEYKSRALPLRQPDRWNLLLSFTSVTCPQM